MYELPYGNTQQLNLDWFIKRWQEFYAQWQEAEAGIDHALDAEIQRVEDAMTDLYAARDAAAASATAAAASASSASNDATTATNAATAAAASATLANNKATAAGLSEAAAANSANSASNSAGAAATSASQANASAASATASEQSATASATAASNSATAAAESASDAADSAQDAQNVLDSIPEDYTNLSNDVSNLKTAINTVTSNLLDFNGIDSMWIQGLPPSPNVPYGCCTDFFEIEENALSIYCAFNAQRYLSQFPTYTNGNVTIYYYDENQQQIAINSASLPYEGPYQNVIPANAKFYRLSISTTKYSDTLTPADLAIGNAFGYIGVDNIEPANILPKYSTLPDYNKQKNIITNALIAKTLANMKADRILYANDFRIVNGALYRITSTIQAGATLTPNTNCVATTIAEVLKTLLS